MNTLSTRIFITALIGLGLSWLLWDALGTPLRKGDGLVMATFALCLCWNLFLAGTIERQLYWLSKGHSRQRATEILIPPKGLRQINQLLHAEHISPEDARMAIVRLDKYIKYYLLTAARLTPSLVILMGLGCSVAALVQTHLSLTKGEALPNMATDLLMLHLLSYGGMGLILGLSLWVGTMQLRTIAETTLRKAGYLIQQTGALDAAPAVRRYPTPTLVLVGALFPLAFIPIAGIQSYNLYSLIVEKGKVVTLAEAQTTLKQNVTELKTKLDENTKDSDAIAAALRSQKEATTQAKAKAAKLQKTINDLIKERDRLNGKLDKLGDEADKTAKALKAEQQTLKEATSKLEAAQKELKTLSTAFDAAKTEWSKEKSASATREAALEEKIAQLTTTQTEMKTELTRADAALKDAVAIRDKLLSRLRVAKPDTKNMHPAIKSLPNGKLVINADVLFKEKSSRLADGAEGILSDVANRMTNILADAEPSAVMVIAAHTDLVPPTGSGDNNTLTAAQAAQIADMFAAQGLTRRRVVPIGFGHHQEQDARLTEDAFAANRRIEFYVLPQLLLDLTIIEKNE